MLEVFYLPCFVFSGLVEVVPFFPVKHVGETVGIGLVGKGFKARTPLTQNVSAGVPYCCMVQKPFSFAVQRYQWKVVVVVD